ncbi:MAG: diaminopimelate decarboxylase [Bacteroidales bacterium]|nr:diaminopimelate decarboxylase [Bacteroidales bacterium]MDD2264641.1 diaminopimelate decarboxylase [Bacteroidales bacterium]MDD2832023.1 diaminopimelate decarboxylase [Bacteroidales bacterium]MDD3209026.1 diaminopimelate decarboxylase [Bacteroidales bacterium]MDD3697860.1 diaminopimelate decarboxylase [Bacteroidales bacterium]
MQLTRFVNAFKRLETPFYFYDLDILDQTLRLYSRFLRKYGYQAHYAMKANANPRILEIIHRAGLGADCVSGNEVQLALDMGFDPDTIVYAGVGKSDREIRTALQGGVFCFNCESVPEIQIINDLASQMGRTARISLRLNPNIDAHTNKHITTGRSRDKFGISEWMLDEVLQVIAESNSVKLIGLHFHIGSQIPDMKVFEKLCDKVNDFQRWFEQRDIRLEHINLGGGIAVDYQDPLGNLFSPFETYFQIINDKLEIRKGQKIHFEPGRALVAQCGFLISRVLYVKVGKGKKFAILDAGMNDLIRPALYGASHAICNITSESEKQEVYDVVGPVCESADRFGLAVKMPETGRGDLVAICSAGAYGQVMSMRYNQRELAQAYYSPDL